MRKPPTMADIAKSLGVSPMTVSRAFKRDAAVSQETRETILKAAEELGYVFDSTAANLRSQKTNFVAVTIPSINNANFAETIRQLSDGLARYDLQILLGYTNYDMQEEERLIEQLLRRKPQAIVVTGCEHTERAHRLLSNAGIPVVETWDLPEQPIGHVVGFSNRLAIQRMVEHFVDAGYRRIAFIGGDAPNDTRGIQRREGFVAAMTEQGLDATRLVDSGAPPIGMREGAVAMAKLLETFPDTDAAICVSDLSAFGALTECQRRGIKVPQDMALGGFGNYDIGAICVPTMTTINAFAGEIGARTAELIGDVLEGRIEPGVPQTVRFTPVLIARESSR